MVTKKKLTKLPDFKEMTDEEIADFWRTHDASEFWADMESVREKFRDIRPKKAISMRIDEQALTELKRLAARKGLGYQTLIRMWIKERLEKELGETA